MNRGVTLATIGSVGVLALVLLIGCSDRTPSSRTDDGSATTALPAIQTDVQQLKDKAADQAHAMFSVAYHFDNMWFAAEAKNWPLAEFYWGETRSHLRWAVRIIPVRKDKAGFEIKLAEILDAMENSPL